MSSKRVPLFRVLCHLALFLASIAKGDDFTIQPLGGALSGPPGVSVSWLFQFANTSNYYAILNSSTFLPSNNPVGIYTDAVSSNFFVINPGDTLPLSLLGEFQIDPAALPGASIAGLLTLSYDAYADDPNSPVFNPNTYVDTFDLSQSASVSVAATSAVPEPSTWFLAGLPICALLIFRAGKRKAGVTLLAAAFSIVIPGTASAQTSAYNILRNSEPGGSGTCHPDSDTTTTSGCCGGPGNHGCIVTGAFSLQFCTDPSTNKLRIDPYSDQVLCNLTPPTCSNSITQALNGSTGNTFFVTSDIHFFRPNFAVKDQITHVSQMNTFTSAGYKWSSFFDINPGSDSDTISPPRGVIVNGDVTLDASGGNLGAFRLLYESGNIGESLKYPMFFGLGNHDVFTQVTGPSYSKRMVDYLMDRMCGVSMDRTNNGLPGSGNYSWDFNNTHFVQLNLWAGDRSRLYAAPIALPPQNEAPGITWLKQDLANKVGNSARPVVVLQHFPMESVTATQSSDLAWSQQNFSDFWDAIRDYNVIAMFAGHTHVPAVNTQLTLIPTLPAQDSIGNPKILDGFTTGTGGQDKKGDFIVARVTDHYLDVGHVEWNSSTGTSPYTPRALNHFADGSPSGWASGCRKRINDQLINLPASLATVTWNAPSRSMTATITRPAGSPVIPGPVAIGVSRVGFALRNRTFVDHCAGAATAFLLLTDAQLAQLNQSGAVDVPLTFEGTPISTATKSLYQLTPIHQALPATVSMVSGVGTNPPSQLDPGLQTVVLTGVPLAPLSVSLTDGKSAPPTWLTALSAPAAYDQFGFARITFRVNPTVVESMRPTALTPALTARLVVANRTLADGYSIPLTLTFKVSSGATLSIDPPFTSNNTTKIPVFSAKLAYGNLAQSVDGAVRPTGSMTLYQGDATNNPVVYKPISYFYVNSNADFVNCNPPPDDTVYFNYRSNNPTQNPANRCPSYLGTGPSTAPFSLFETKGRFNYYVAYSGDSNYAPGVSPVMTYRIGPDPASITKTSGDAQSVPLVKAYPKALKVRVADASNIALPNVDVTFTANLGTNGASATFPGNVKTVTVISDSTGIATAPILTANDLPGIFSVSVALPGATPTAVFTETITPLTTAPDLTASIVKRTEVFPVRTWSIQVVNHGGPATQPQITYLALTQTGGPLCTAPPTITTSLPVNVILGSTTEIRLNFAGCSATSRFTATIGMAANGGTARFITTLGNQFP
jgi:cytolysin (calcineurin-like family phosphatase)